MKTLDEIRNIIREHRNVLAEKYGVAVVGVFGSFVRLEQREQSDIDLLVDIHMATTSARIVSRSSSRTSRFGTRSTLAPRYTALR